jgi:hypothetical protein
MAQAKVPKWSREDLLTDPDKRTTCIRKGWRSGRDDPADKYLTVSEYYSDEKVAQRSEVMTTNVREWNERRKKEAEEYAEYAQLMKAAARMGIVSSPDIKYLGELADALATTLTTEMLTGDLKPKNATEAVKVLQVVNEVRKGLKPDAGTKAEDTDTADAQAAVKDRLAKLRVVKDQTA